MAYFPKVHDLLKIYQISSVWNNFLFIYGYDLHSQRLNCFKNLPLASPVIPRAHTPHTSLRAGSHTDGAEKRNNVSLRNGKKFLTFPCPIADIPK